MSCTYRTVPLKIIIECRSLRPIIIERYNFLYYQYVLPQIITDFSTGFQLTPTGNKKYQVIHNESYNDLENPIIIFIWVQIGITISMLGAAPILV